MLSAELPRGKAAEHLVCADLILQGYNAFLADQGLPYDVVVDVNGSLLRVQVRGAGQARDYGRSKAVYRFNFRQGKHSDPIWRGRSDVYALVMLDARKIAYLSERSLVMPSGQLKQLAEFRADKFSRFVSFAEAIAP